MALSRGYSYDQMLQLHALLRSHHRVSVEVSILDANGAFLHDASSYLVSGQIDYDADATITRSGSVVIMDPFHQFDLDSNASGQKFYNRQLRAVYTVRPLIDMGVAFSYPLFTGPIANAARNSINLDLELAGKEIFGDNGMRADYTWPAGWDKANVIMNALQVHLGETAFDWRPGDHFNRGMYIPWTIERGENIFDRLRELAKSFGHRLYYDGWGNCVLKPVSYSPQWQLDSTWLTSEPQVNFDIDAVKNDIIVTGAGGSDNELVFEIPAPPEHPYSPQALARNGVPRYLTEFINDDSITAYQNAYVVAADALQEGLMRTLDVSATAAVLPYIEEWDAFSVSHPKYSGTTMLTKATIPLVGDGEMSVGFMSSTSDSSYSTANYETAAFGIDTANDKAAFDKGRAEYKEKERKAKRKAQKAYDKANKSAKKSGNDVILAGKGSPKKKNPKKPKGKGK